MTSTATDTITAPPAAPVTSSFVDGRVTVRRVISSELIKMRSLVSRTDTGRVATVPVPRSSI